MVGVERVVQHRDARVLERDGIDRARHDEIVADRDGVPVLLRRPATDPGPPRAIAAEDARDLVVVARQIVLGKEVDDEARARGVAVALLLR